jgi:hypothetical protein
VLISRQMPRSRHDPWRFTLEAQASALKNDLDFQSRY